MNKAYVRFRKAQTLLVLGGYVSTQTRLCHAGLAPNLMAILVARGEEPGNGTPGPAARMGVVALTAFSTAAPASRLPLTGPSAASTCLMSSAIACSSVVDNGRTCRPAALGLPLRMRVPEVVAGRGLGWGMGDPTPCVSPLGQKYVALSAGEARTLCHRRVCLCHPTAVSTAPAAAKSELPPMPSNADPPPPRTAPPPRPECARVTPRRLTAPVSVCTFLPAIRTPRGVRSACASSPSRASLRTRASPDARWVLRGDTQTEAPCRLKVVSNGVLSCLPPSATMPAAVCGRSAPVGTVGGDDLTPARRLTLAYPPASRCRLRTAALLVASACRGVRCSVGVDHVKLSFSACDDACDSAASAAPSIASGVPTAGRRVSGPTAAVGSASGSWGALPTRARLLPRPRAARVRRGGLWPPVLVARRSDARLAVVVGDDGDARAYRCLRAAFASSDGIGDAVATSASSS